MVTCQEASQFMGVNLVSWRAFISALVPKLSLMGVVGFDKQYAY